MSDQPRTPAPIFGGRQHDPSGRCWSCRVHRGHGHLLGCPVAVLAAAGAASAPLPAAAPEQERPSA